MQRNAVLIGLASWIAAGTALGLERSERLIAPTLTVELGNLRAGERIPVKVSIHNELRVALRYCTRSLEPTADNDETFALDLRAAYRLSAGEAAPASVVRRPEVHLDPRISLGARCHTIAPGGALAIRTDLAKWTLDGGWRPGRYAVSMRVSGLTFEGDPLTRIESTTELASFELR